MSSSKSPERQFLHDIATPLGTAMFLLDILQEKMSARGPGDEDLEHLNGAIEALQKLKQHIVQRRQALTSAQSS